MPERRPNLLGENTGLAFLGEQPWLSGRLTPQQAKSFEAAQNPSGRPNADVIRHLTGFESGRRTEHIQVDFPSHFTEQEAALYVKPFAHLRPGKSSVEASLPATRDQPSPGQARSRNSNLVRQHPWWLNPHAQPDLRTALARLDRYLATPLAAESPSWDWIDSATLPDDTLLAVTCDDDFTHGLLQSRFFTSWSHAWSRQLSPTEIVGTFPFPWPPATLLSALTRAQEEHRLAIARAARAGAQDQLNSAVASAYSWPDDLANEEILTNLTALNLLRSR